MSEERLQEIKDSIDFQDMWCKEHNMDNILAKEEQELVEEIERLHSITKEAREYIKEKYIEDYSNNDNYIPLEQLNLKNCSWERSLQVLEILDKENK